MSVSPPPPPPAPPPPIEPRPFSWDRRAQREQRRAAKMAMRQQRARLRLQRRSTRKASVLGPVLLVALGVTFLWDEMGHVPLSALVLWMSRWWPLLLLAAGFVLLAEWLMDNRQFTPQQGLPQRRTGTGGIALLILLVLVGLLSAAARTSSDWLHGHLNGDLVESLGFDQWLEQHSENDQELSATMEPGAVLTIENHRGDIEVTGSSPDDQVHVAVHQRFVAWRQQDLATRAKQDLPRLQASGSGLVLSVPGTDKDRADLTVELPHVSGLQVLPETGEITVNELRGPLTVGTHAGNITLTALTGNVQIASNDDDATLTGHSLSGTITLSGRTGDLAFSDVTGAMNLQGDFFGTTLLERIAGPVHFQSSFTNFACKAIAGELTVEGRSQLHAEAIDGPVSLSTTDRSISLEDVRHGLTLNDRNGTVTVFLAEPLGPMQINNTDGPVTVQVPDRALTLDAIAKDGQISTDLGLKPQQSGNHSSLAGQYRGPGPLLSIRTSEGDIHILRARKPAGLDDSPSEDPN